jgi:pimeloyl-ACP methyl ester carboxylesterase
MMIRGLAFRVSCLGGLSVLALVIQASGESGPTAALGRLRAAPKDDGNAEHPEVKFLQVFPAIKNPARFMRSEGRHRAVVLIHGYWLHFKKENVARAFFKDWQGRRSLLVKALAKDSDVYAVAYGESVSVEEVADLPELGQGVARLRKLGYEQIVLVGHSAGGLVAREFVEDHPDAGVTKVIQVCAPNGGSIYADLKLIPKNQRLFVDSLCKAGRDKCLHLRAGKKIPPGVQFLCVLTIEDLVVPCRAQWTPDLQSQGVPVVRVDVGHRQVMRKRSSAQKIAELVRQRHTRWSKSEVAAVRDDLFKPKKAN